MPVATAFLATVVAPGCGEDFDPFNRLTSLRVLAVQADPVAPLPKETSVLTPLVYTKEPVALTYAWSWCPLAGAADDGFPCLIDEAGLAALAGGGGMDAGLIPPFSLGTGPTASFPHTLNPALLAALCSGTLPGVPKLNDCREGFPVQVRLDVRAPDGEQLTTVRTLHLRFDTTTAANENPNLAGLSAVFDDRVDALDDRALVTLPRRRETPIRALADPSAAQPYTGFDENDAPLPTHERLFLSWFVESGDTQREKTVYINEMEVKFEDFLKNKWRPANAEDFPPESARLIVVLRDNRGGVSWRSARVQLGDRPLDGGPSAVADGGVDGP